MKYYLVVLFTYLVPFVYSQKTLSLEDAVMQQYRAFYPERVVGFNWLPNTTKYVYMSADRATLYKSNVSSQKEQILMTKEQLSEILETDIRGFYPLKFINEDVFHMNNGSSFFEVNLKNRSGKTLHILEKMNRLKMKSYYLKH